MSEHQSKDLEQKHEISPPSLELMLLGIAAELGCFETEEMKSLRDSVFQLSDPESAARLIGDYNIMATMLPRPLSITESTRLITAVMLITTAVIERCSLYEDVSEYLFDAQSHAENTGDINTSSIIKRLIQIYA